MTALLRLLCELSLWIMPGNALSIQDGAGQSRYPSEIRPTRDEREWLGALVFSAGG